MNIEIHTINNTTIAALNAEYFIINSIEDGVDLLGNIYFQGYDKIIIQEENITPHFFDLKNGMAGEILQKFSTYKVRLTIVGDFTKYESKSLQSFIYESNQGSIINFESNISEALRKISQ